MKHSNSSIKSFRRCKRQYYYGYVRGLETRFPNESLKRGTWFHEVIASHDKGEDWQETHKKLTRQFNNLLIEERERYGNLPDQVERMVRGYLHHYRKNYKDWEILAVEQSFEIEVDGFTITIQPDLIVRDHSMPVPKVFVVDRKTVRALPSLGFRLTDLQSTLYPWVLEKSDQIDYEIHGFIFDYIRSKAPTVPSINKDGSISRRRIDTEYYTLAKFLLDYYEVRTVKELPPNWQTQLHTLNTHNSYFKRSTLIKNKTLVNTQVSEFLTTAGEVEQMRSLGKSPWVRTPSPDCERFCQFSDLCTAELLGNDTTFILKQYRANSYVKRRELGVEIEESE